MTATEWERRYRRLFALTTARHGVSLWESPEACGLRNGMTREQYERFTPAEQARLEGVAESLYQESIGEARRR